MDVALVLTHECNLGCSYCYMGAKERRPMPLAVAEAALDLAFSDGVSRASSGKPLQLSFFGGEPLIAWDALVEITARAKARAAALGRALVLTVTTNGTLVDERRADWLVAEGFYVGLSIDGARAGHEATRPFAARRQGLPVVSGGDGSGGCGPSSFDRTLRTLDLLVARGARLETISVVDPRNVDHLGAGVRFLVERGVTRVSLNPSFGADWSDAGLAAWRRGYEEAAALYVERLRAGRPFYLNVVEDKMLTHLKGGYGPEDRCKTGQGGVAVAPSGNLYPCERMVEEDRDPTLRIGHVSTGVVRDVAAGSGCESSTGSGGAPECGGCGVRDRCMSFCACANRAETGRTDEPGGVQCWHERMAIEIADRAAAALWRARDRRFVARLYAYDHVAAEVA